MAESSECFNIGSLVSCKTCFNEDLQGEVLAFDPNVKLLTLKSAASSGRTSLCDIRMVNLSYVSQVTVIREAAASPLPSLPSLNLDKLNSRAKRSIEAKQRLIQALQSGVTPDGQKLFLTICKTIEEVTWMGPNILVMSQVIITPPYLPENVREHKDSKDSNMKTLNYIKKIVDKFHKDQQSVSLNNGTNVAPVVAEVQPVSQ
ncbi:protein with role in RNA processing [Halocaridina rubra]|uniref:Protein with role in RNA processing n=1 Tax=Halocaridina rubra TaxID=373956 RepID=A0AAN8X5E9_HALRR